MNGFDWQTSRLGSTYQYHKHNLNGNILKPKENSHYPWKVNLKARSDGLRKMH